MDTEVSPPISYGFEPCLQACPHRMVQYDLRDFLLVAGGVTRVNADELLSKSYDFVWVDRRTSVTELLCMGVGSCIVSPGE